jgi:alpha-L-arabinofuranosidase
MFASYLGDHTVRSSVENGGAKFFYSSTVNSAKKQLYLKLVNASSDPQPLEIALPGAQPKPMAKLVRLNAPDTQTTNSIDDPNRVVPLEMPVDDVSSKFSITLPAYSIQVLQIDLQ